MDFSWHQSLRLGSSSTASYQMRNLEPRSKMTQQGWREIEFKMIFSGTAEARFKQEIIWLIIFTKQGKVKMSMEQITSLLLRKNTKGPFSTEMPLYKVWRNTGQETGRNWKIKIVIYILSKLLFTSNAQQQSVTSVIPRWCLHRIRITDNTTAAIKTWVRTIFRLLFRHW